MSIFYYDRSIGNRKGGKNGVFAVAYIRGEKRTCYRTQDTKDFNCKDEIVFKECILPEDAPAWATKLRNAHVRVGADTQFDVAGQTFSEYAWNQLEIMDKRKDSNVYFHDVFAIPIELEQEAAIELVRDFAKETIAQNGIFCDVAVHWNLVNPHAHIIFPWRKLTEDGYSKKMRLSPGEMRENIKSVRAAWADFANRKLKEVGIDSRIDHRSYKERGIDLEPTLKVGKAHYMSDSSYQQSRLARNEIIRANNAKAVAQDPQILATKLASEHAIVTQDHVVSEAQKHAVGEAVLAQIRHEDDLSLEAKVDAVIGDLKANNTIFSDRTLRESALSWCDDNAEFEALVGRICQSDQLISLGLGLDGREHYSTRETFDMELELSRDSVLLSRKAGTAIDRDLLRGSFSKFTLNESQQVALSHICASSKLSIVTGFAGVGKTHMLNAAREVWEQSGFRVYGISFSGRAAESLQDGANIRSSTIAAFIKNVAEHRIVLNENSVIVMDEMGMTSLDDMAHVIKIVKAAGAKFAGVGDTEQTQSVGRGALMRAMIAEIGSVQMDTIVRQSGWQREATLHMEQCESQKGLALYRENGMVSLVDNHSMAVDHIIDRWHECYAQGKHGLSEQIIIAHKNESVQALNIKARERLLDGGLLKAGQSFKTASGDIPISVGERILFGANNSYIGVKNGSFGEVVAIEENALSVRLDNGKDVRVNLNQYNHINYGYAATVHKVQGATVDYAFEYIDGPTWDRHLFLVGSSRHRKGLEIVASKECFSDYEALQEVVSRHALKDYVLDYPTSFALRRGFDEQRAHSMTVNFLRKAKDKVSDAMLWVNNYEAWLDKKAHEGRVIQEVDRRSAVKVADFADNRCRVGVLAQEIQSLPGYEIELHRDGFVPDDAIADAIVHLYAHDGGIYGSGCIDGEVVRVLFDADSEIGARLIEVMADATHTRLSGDDRADAFSVLENHGFNALDADKRIALQREIYAIKLKNAKIAEAIWDDQHNLSVAIDKNRVRRSNLDEAITFGAQRVQIEGMVESFNLGQFYDAQGADQVLSDFSSYYGHIISCLGDTQDKSIFITTLKTQAYDWRYGQLIESMDASHHDDIKCVKRYLDLDTEISLNLMKPQDQQIEQTLLHSMSVERNALADRIILHDGCSDLVDHFGANVERIKKHQRSHAARMSVVRFRDLLGDNSTIALREREVLAHRFRETPKAYGPFIHELLDDGFRAINLDNWRYNQRMTLANASVAFKAGHRLIQAYYERCKLTQEAWQSAMAKTRAGSANAKMSRLKAQGLSVHRDQMASQLIESLERHSGALGFNKVNLETLSLRARHYDYFARYQREENPQRKMRQAYHMVQNLKAYGSYLQVHGMMGDVHDKAHHYEYLHRVKSAPDASIREVLRANELYQLKAREASLAWRMAKAINGEGTASYDRDMARHLMVQRNIAAHNLWECMRSHDLLGTSIAGVEIDYTRLEKAVSQYHSQERIKSYLQAPTQDRGKLAQAILNDRAGYHLVFANNIAFETLTQEARAYTQSLAQQGKVVERRTHYWDAQTITQALLNNYEDHYKAIFGEHGDHQFKKREKDQLRFGSGLLVSTSGQHAGSWYCHVTDEGGGPIQAIQYITGKSFKEALEEGARMAGLSEFDAEIKVTRERINAPQKTPTITDAQRIESAISIWDSSILSLETLSERYFKEHRGIDNVSTLEVRHFPVGAQWINYDDQTGERVVKTNKVPAAVIALTNAQGQITGVQRIYLDKHTAGKATFMDNPKLSKGISKGAGGILQRGLPGSTLYLAEGPETGASIAKADPDATVIVSTGVRNLDQLGGVVKNFEPSKVIVAGDYDGVDAPTRATTDKAAMRLQNDLGEIQCKVIYPKPIDGMQKVDFNDVLKVRGMPSLKHELGLVSTHEILWSEGKHVAYSPAEHYLREVKGLVGADLSDLRYHNDVSVDGLSSHAILASIQSSDGKRQGVMVFALDQEANNITKAFVLGRARDGFVVMRQGDSADTYVASNLLDAKALTITCENKNDTILLSPNNFENLNNIEKFMQTNYHDNNFLMICVENDSKRTQARIAEKLSGVDAPGINKFLHYGDIREQHDYTHISIHDAMLYAKNTAINIPVKTVRVKAPEIKRPSFKERAMGAMGLVKVKDQVLEKVLQPKVPEIDSAYIAFTDDEQKLINDYMRAYQDLQKNDRYEDAVNVARASVHAKKSLNDRVNPLLNNERAFTSHLNNASSIDTISERIAAGKAITTLDARVLREHISQPHLDTNTKLEFQEVAERRRHDISPGDDYEMLCNQFMESKKEYIDTMMQDDSLSVVTCWANDETLDHIKNGKVGVSEFVGMTKDFKKHTTQAREAESRSRSRSRSQGISW